MRCLMQAYRHYTKRTTCLRPVTSSNFLQRFFSIPPPFAFCSVACSALAGYYCPTGTAVNSISANGWTLCPVGKTCAGGAYQPWAPKPFTAGSASVVRLGDGVGAYTLATLPIFIDEYDVTTYPWVLLQTILLPVVANGAQQAVSLLSAPNSVADVGFLSRSADGRYLTMAAFGVAPGTAASSLASGGYNSVIVRVDYLGNVDTSTVAQYADGSGKVWSIKSAVTFDGSSYVFTGDYASAPSLGASLWAGPKFVNYQAHGSVTASVSSVQSYQGAVQAINNSAAYPGTGSFGGGFPTLSSSDTWRAVHYYGGQLYVSHTWARSSPLPFATKAFSDISTPSSPLPSDVDLANSTWTNRFLWDNTNPKNILGFAFLDQGARILVCDRGSSMKAYQAPSASALSGVANVTTTNVAPGYASLSCGDTTTVSTTCPCFGVAAYDNLAWFTTDTHVYTIKLPGTQPPGSGALPAPYTIRTNTIVSTLAAPVQWALSMSLGNRLMSWLCDVSCRRALTSLRTVIIIAPLVFAAPRRRAPLGSSAALSTCGPRTCSCVARRPRPPVPCCQTLLSCLSPSWTG